ncbi:MAG: arsenate reductase family protein [Phormidium sp. BM_Day4_Bin.17]|nr:arsenate reductase family protein [Phormidium sp. BM_Day4_Bin.17]UCJ14062.1 MAG: arsenate reductase family protein [Phormidium sp. PBR-2020]
MLTLYGIPHCGTCNKAIAWLNDHNIPHNFINVKTDPPNAELITAWVGQLGNKPLRNTSGQSYRALGPERNHWSDAQWIAAFAADAMLLKRPIFIKDEIAILTGFRKSETDLINLLT